MQLGGMFISNCNNTIHVSDAFCVHPQEHLKTVVTALSHIVYTQYDLVWKQSTLDTHIGHFTPSHVINQRLLHQFLSAPEDGRKRRPKHVEYYCSY